MNIYLVYVDLEHARNRVKVRARTFEEAERIGAGLLYRGPASVITRYLKTVSTRWDAKELPGAYVEENQVCMC